MTHTFKITLKFATATAVLAVLASSALAGDLSNGGPGGLKDGRGGAVPVPVPVPYEEHYKYYIGGSVSWGFLTSAKIDGSTTGGEAIDLAQSGRFFGPASGSLVVGRYITPSLRVELGADVRMPITVASGKSNYQTRAYAPGPNQTLTHNESNPVTTSTPVVDPFTGAVTFATTTSIQVTTVVDYSGASQNYNQYRVAHTEKASLMSHTFMLSLAHDFNREGRFNPYIGAGVGFVTHLLHRDSVDSGVCVRGGNDILDLYGRPSTGTCSNTELLPDKFKQTGSRSALGVGLAASVQAGVNYKLSDRTHWDTGYRLIWMGGKVASAVETSNGLGTTILSVGNRIDHEVRTGLRFDLW